MEKTKRNPALKVIGAILIVAGVITFIVSAVQLYDVQTTTTHWAEGFMQDYQARTNATNSGSIIKVGVRDRAYKKISKK